jgi:Fe2+ transport system protein FeoA
MARATRLVSRGSTLKLTLAMKSEQSHSTYQIAAPQLASIRSSAITRLLRQWLQDCDDNHSYCRHDQRLYPAERTELPTRLLAIGTSPGSLIRVVYPANGTQSLSKNVQYAALSYRWGEASFFYDYQTTRANIHEKTSGIDFARLPSVLQDAIEVARAIGVQYIWIDALCIIQGAGGDYDSEAERMETVFSGAYCVIAASRAADVSHSILAERPPREVIALPMTHGDNASIFIAEDIDSFQRDVIDGELNQRGWVLQERALARRTIYFAESQIYWECGAGIRCESFTKMSKYVSASAAPLLFNMRND